MQCSAGAGTACCTLYTPGARWPASQYSWQLPSDTISSARVTCAMQLEATVHNNNSEAHIFSYIYPNRRQLT